MKIIFTHHAKYRLMERSIYVNDIKQTIKYPDQCQIGSNGKILARKNINGKILEAVYKIRGNSYIVITIYYENNL